MANKFINSKWAKVYLANVIDAMPYVKASKSYFADQMKGKKCGKTYSFVLRDSGKVSDGLAIASGDNKDVLEKEVKLTLQNKKNIVSLDVLESIVDVSDFNDEFANYAIHLGAEIQKTAIEGTIFDASTAHIESTNGWAPLSHAIAGLKSRRVGGSIVGFLDPVAESNLSVNALNNWSFAPSQKGEQFYADGSVGKFQGSEFVYANDLPQITGKTVSANNVVSASESGGVYNLALSGAIGVDLEAGTPFHVAGAKVCNSVGMPTNQDFAFIAQENITSADTSIKVQRIDIDEGGARNVFMTGVSALSGVSGSLTCPLEPGVPYSVAQVRTNDVLAFENAPLDDLVGAENSTVEVGGIKLKTTVLGNSQNMENLSRWDIAFGTTIVDNRESSLVYLKV